ncbi:PSP1 C-terminal conserved region-domain-containing protein [Gautieria morchelliformis]|nr:PSP1 C-terminal conserved region-domain-containing protein [Gautieria morchelliformis]
MQIDDADRRSRQLFEGVTNGHHQAVRERAASQPPHPNDPFSSSPLGSVNYGLRTGLAEQQQPTWPQQSRFTSLSHSTSLGLPQSVPTRSSSFSGSQDRPHPNLLSAMRDNPRFASTFEDDESEALSDSFSSFDDRPLNGRLHPGHYGPDGTRSRSQSLLVSQPASADLPRNWTRDSSYGRYPTSSSRYNNTMGAADPNFLNASSTPTAIPGRGGRSNADISNISPFTRDIHQILLLGDRSAIRDQVGPTMGPPGQRDDPSGGASGSTSRRHSVSYYQPRRDIGFQVPGSAANDDSASSMLPANPYHSNVLSDEELASDLNMLSMGMDTLTVSGAHSQPSSLPNFPPGRSLLSQSPDPASTNTRYLPLRPAEFNNRTSFSPSSHLDSTSVSDRATSASPRSDAANPFGAPSRHPSDVKTDFSGSLSPGGASAPRYVQPYANANTGAMPTSPVYGQRAPSFGGPASPLASPLSPGLQNSLSRVYPAQTYMSSAPPSAREPLSPTLADLGKGVPLHSVPPSCPLFIVEFKAGRTDLFYTTERVHDISAGDLVIVEADRGKDLGKVVNDSITLAEVEAFQKAQAQKAMHAANLMDGPPVKRDINPKRIYGKAQPHDTQLLASKIQDELKALQLCQSKVRGKKLPMEVVDAEYQWDRRKLTFYFIAEKRIDFRELVRELFRLYKTRIWMASLQGPQE